MNLHLNPRTNITYIPVLVLVEAFLGSYMSSGELDPSPSGRFYAGSGLCGQVSLGTALTLAVQSETVSGHLPNDS